MVKKAKRRERNPEGQCPHCQKTMFLVFRKRSIYMQDKVMTLYSCPECKIEAPWWSK